MRLLLITVLASSVTLVDAPQRSETPCSDAKTCRQQALNAASQRDFETFLSLAWRAVHVGPKNDPDLMFLVARAQSLSGRPQDALVMLQRLAQSGFAPQDAETSDDFRSVRLLAGWPEVQKAIQATARTGKVLVGDFIQFVQSSPPDEGVPAPAANTTPPAAPPSDTAKGVARPIVRPISLAYDAVSRRFVLADERSRTLKIIDDLAGNVVNLVTRGWSGDYETSALAIDRRRGDLWVAGVQQPGTNGHVTSALHHLQLVSGRLLSTQSLPADAGPARFVDIAVTNGGQVFVLDALGKRIYRGGAGVKTLTLLTKINVADATSLAPAAPGVVYVAHPDGLVRVNVEARTSANVKTGGDVSIDNLQWIGWHANSLVGIQRTADGLSAVRIVLDARGRTATKREVLEQAASRAASVADGVFYFVAPDEGDGLKVQRVTLR